MTSVAGQLNDKQMAEAEVVTRLAFWLIRNNLVGETMDLGIDGAQVKVGSLRIFPLVEFLQTHGWQRTRFEGPYQGLYKHEKSPTELRIHARSGFGDLVATLHDGRRILVEAKKGPLEACPSSSEYSALRGAIGQLVTLEDAQPTDVLVAATPYSARFASLAARWRSAPAMKKAGILIATVDRNNHVDGLGCLLSKH